MIVLEEPDVTLCNLRFQQLRRHWIPMGYPYYGIPDTYTLGYQIPIPWDTHWGLMGTEALPP